MKQRAKDRAHGLRTPKKGAHLSARSPSPRPHLSQAKPLGKNSISGPKRDPAHPTFTSQTAHAPIQVPPEQASKAEGLGCRGTFPQRRFLRQRRCRAQLCTTSSISHVCPKQRRRQRATATLQAGELLGEGCRARAKVINKGTQLVESPAYRQKAAH